MADIPAVQEIEQNSFSDPWTRITMEDAVTSFRTQHLLPSLRGRFADISSVELKIPARRFWTYL